MKPTLHHRTPFTQVIIVCIDADILMIPSRNDFDFD
jgi:hypothetical protein